MGGTPIQSTTGNAAHELDDQELEVSPLQFNFSPDPAIGGRGRGRGRGRGPATRAFTFEAPSIMTPSPTNQDSLDAMLLAEVEAQREMQAMKERVATEVSTRMHTGVRIVSGMERLLDEMQIAREARQGNNPNSDSE